MSRRRLQVLSNVEVRRVPIGAVTAGIRHGDGLAIRWFIPRATLEEAVAVAGSGVLPNSLLIQRGPLTVQLIVCRDNEAAVALAKSANKRWRPSAPPPAAAKPGGVA